ncbi:M67 family metallopeptidase [Methylomarinum sp. Ch1-1]|uniref:M67 family metallopeptidase n=1 Tax=Methylomarinum roseum TaxID=3067653 RepID=A0AAU7P057_9GAMM|nr:M67 family metallopeptidase [Methylomarinum sp. Ch1-1]MDP4519030.1 M67 family metallopeptidase [Methylomarinum sp. Ch1-1]
MKRHEIQLSRKLTTELLHLAQISPEAEICGLIGARDGQPTRCYPIDNIAARPDSRFELDPQQHIAAVAQMRENGEDLFAIYHSHPHAPAEPSATDIDMANYPEAIYLVISLNTKGILEMRGFNIVDKQVQEVTLRMSE